MTPLLQIALYEPKIPPNTGNVARLCAANGLPLHLIGELGFRLTDADLRRAGLDYWPSVDLRLHASMADFEKTLSGRLFCFSAHAREPYSTIRYQTGDCLLFGNENHGLPADIVQRYADTLVTIPMSTKNVRCLNLSTAVGIGAYEALRQLHAW